MQAGTPIYEVNMFGIGLPEMIIILAVALIVVGPDKLPELARSLAKGVQELKKTVNQVKDSFNEEGNVLGDVHKEVTKTANEINSHLLDNDTNFNNPTDIDPAIDLQPLAERPWERERKTEPQSNTAAIMATKAPSIVFDAPEEKEKKEPEPQTSPEPAQEEKTATKNEV